MRVLLLLLAIGLGALSAGVLLALLLMPLWSWLDTRIGIEALGHSGPAPAALGKASVRWLDASPTESLAQERQWLARGEWQCP